MWGEQPAEFGVRAGLVGVQYSTARGQSESYIRAAPAYRSCSVSGFDRSARGRQPICFSPKGRNLCDPSSSACVSWRQPALAKCQVHRHHRPARPWDPPRKPKRRVARNCRFMAPSRPLRQTRSFPPSLLVNGTGTGTATHLGRYTSTFRPRSPSRTVRQPEASGSSQPTGTAWTPRFSDRVRLRASPTSSALWKFPLLPAVLVDSPVQQAHSRSTASSIRLRVCPPGPLTGSSARAIEPSSDLAFRHPTQSPLSSRAVIEASCPARSRSRIRGAARLRTVRVAPSHAPSDPMQQVANLGSARTASKTGSAATVRPRSHPTSTLLAG